MQSTFMGKLTTMFVLLLLTLQSYSQIKNRAFIDSGIYKIINVNPSITNAAIHTWDTAHVVYYDTKLKNNKILLWLAGTNGTPLNVSVDFYNTALQQGYRIVALAYITVPAVAQVCKDEILKTSPDCTALFRRKRIYGDNNFALIADEPQDAIIPRFVSLLQWLIKNDSAGNWSQYLSSDGAQPNWKNIAIAGQSQGGGMAEYIGMQENVARIISFSGGWDYSNSKEKQIAKWYYDKPVTPLENWYATYNVNENTAALLKEICEALKIPASNVFALDKPLTAGGSAIETGNPYHADGKKNIAYKPIWIKMLGSGRN